MSSISGPPLYDYNRNTYDSYNVGSSSNLSGQGSYGPLVHTDPRFPIQPEADPTLHRSRFH